MVVQRGYQKTSTNFAATGGSCRSSSSSFGWGIPPSTPSQRRLTQQTIVIDQKLRLNAATEALCSEMGEKMEGGLFVLRLHGATTAGDAGRRDGARIALPFPAPESVRLSLFAYPHPRPHHHIHQPTAIHSVGIDRSKTSSTEDESCGGLDRRQRPRASNVWREHSVLTSRWNKEHDSDDRGFISRCSS